MIPHDDPRRRAFYRHEYGRNAANRIGFDSGLRQYHRGN